jgi:hypothetical protein
MTKLTKARVWFDRKSALATAVGAAFALGPDTNLRATVADETVPVHSEAQAIEALSVLSPITEVTDRATASAPILETDSPEQEWTRVLQHRFNELAVKEALEEISPREAQELEHLTSMRRSYQKPRSADEVLWEYEQRQLTQQLLEILKNYVEFYEGPSEAWLPTKKDSHGK